LGGAVFGEGVGEEEAWDVQAEGEGTVEAAGEEVFSDDGYFGDFVFLFAACWGIACGSDLWLTAA